MQRPTARHEEAAAPQVPPLASASAQVDAQAPPQSPEPRRKLDFKLFAWVLTIAGCGLIVLAAGTLAIRVELGYERRQLVAEYEAKKHDLITEYQAKQRELETEYEAQKRELTTELETEYEAKQRELTTELETEEETQKRKLVSEYEAKKRDLVSEYAAKSHKLTAEYQTKKDRNDAEKRKAIAEYKRKEEQLAADYDRRLEAMHEPNGASAAPQKTASIFDTKPAGYLDRFREAGVPSAVLSTILSQPIAFGILSAEDLHETERLGSDWRDNVDWTSPAEFFGKTSRPDRVETLRYQYFVDGDDHPITPAEVEEYLALPYEKRMAVCSLSRRRLLTMRRAGDAYPPRPPNGRAAQ